MNIKFGMDNFYVRYLKRFLNNEMNEMTSVLGKFDKDDLSLLIKYLNLPNVKSMFEVHTDIKNEIPELDNKFNIILSIFPLSIAVIISSSSVSKITFKL